MKQVRLFLFNLLFALLLIGWSSNAWSQTAAQYFFSASSGTYTPIAGATIFGPGDDDNISNIPIGFSFKFAGVDYTYANVCANGYLTLATSNAGVTTSSSYTNSDFQKAGAYPVLAPLWDDLKVGTNGSVTFQVSGVSPNQVLTVQWSEMLWDYNASGDVISFQAKLYESSGNIEYSYQQGASDINSSSLGATIGICSAAGVYLTLSDAGTSPIAGSAFVYFNITTKPATGQVYTFAGSSTPATVTTQAVSSITSYTATGNGNITTLGIPNPTAYGICWNTTGTPTITDSKVDVGAASATGAFTAAMTSLSASTMYYVRTFAANDIDTTYGNEVTFTTPAPGTWTGAVNTDWTNTGNWAGGSVPTAAINVVVPASGIVNYPVINPSVSAECNNIKTWSNLTINSTSDGTGSLIVHGTVTGKITTNHYLTAGQWQLVTPPGQSCDIELFVGGNSSVSKKVNGATTTYAIAGYNEEGNKWGDYFTNATSGSFSAGKGYLMRSDNNASVSFEAQIVKGTYPVNLTKAGDGWNCIGNPYTSYIKMNDAADANYNFIKTNINALDEAFACIYIWDSNTNEYKIISNVDHGTRNYANNLLSSGQGFFVKASANGSVVFFESNIQTHPTVLLGKAAKIAWPSITLNVTNGTKASSTLVAFNSEMTKGLDPSYDAGLLRGTSGLNVYSHLVEGSDVDFAVQALPSADESVVIPIGIDSKEASHITFSAETVELPANTSVVLEDKTTGTLTSLTDGGVYTATVEAGAKGTGRFYLHTKSASTTTDIVTGEAATVSAYASNKTITINGKLAGATVQLFDINGKQVDVAKLATNNVSTLDESKLIDGVYVLRVIASGKVYSFKVVLK